MSKIENLNFYIVEDGYIEYISKWDDHIAYNKNNKRPYVGIVLKINGFRIFHQCFLLRNNMDVTKKILPFLKCMEIVSRKNILD